MLWPPATVGRACRRQHAAKSTCTWRNWLLARTITHAPLAAKEIIATTRPDHQLAGLHTHVHVLFSTRSPRGAQSAAFVHAHVCRILWRRAMRVAVMTNHGRADARRQGATDARPCGNQVLGRVSIHGTLPIFVSIHVIFLYLQGLIVFGVCFDYPAEGDT